MADVIDEILASGKPATPEQWCYVEMYVRWQMTNFYKRYTKDSEAVRDRAYVLMRAAQYYLDNGYKAYMAVTWYNWHVADIETVFIAKKMSIGFGSDGYRESDGYKALEGITFSSPVEELSAHRTLISRVGKVLQVYLRYKPQTDMEWLQGWFATEPAFTGRTAQVNFLDDVRKLEMALASIKEVEHARPESELGQDEELYTFPE